VDGHPESFRAVRIMDWTVFRLWSNSLVADLGKRVSIEFIASLNCEILAPIFSPSPMREKCLPYAWLFFATSSSLRNSLSAAMLSMTQVDSRQSV
jgi:hypothetical protein